MWDALSSKQGINGPVMPKIVLVSEEVTCYSANEVQMEKAKEFVLENWETIDTYMHPSMSDDDIRETLGEILRNNSFDGEEIMLTIRDYQVIMLFRTYGRH